MAVLKLLESDPQVLGTLGDFNTSVGFASPVGNS